MANINIYRGFSNVQEAIQVLTNETAGGVPFMSNEEWDKLYGQEKSEVIDQQILGRGGSEGAVRVTYRNKRDRKGVIEYTLDSGVAQGYGTLCVIGATVDDSAILVQTPNRENSVVFRTCEPIFIHSFALGWFYNGYSKPIPEELTLSKILCKWKQDSVVSLFLYLNSVFKHKHKLIHNQAPV